MPSWLFDTIVEQLLPHVHTVDLRGWGESTILPDFVERLRVIAQSGARPRIVTNGLAMKAEYWELFWSADGVVVVSVDAATPELFGQLGRGDFHKMLRNVVEGLAIRERVGRGVLYFTTTVSAFNAHELPAIVGLAARHGVTKVFAHPVKTGPDFYASTATVRDELPTLIDKAVQMARASGVVFQLGAALDPSLVVAHGLPETCSSPWSHALISYRGDVLFCDHLVNKSEYSMGNLGVSTFREIWNGEPFQEVRKAHLRAEATRCVGPAFGKCNWCYANRYKDSEAAPIPSEAARDVSTLSALPLYEMQPSGGCVEQRARQVGLS